MRILVTGANGYLGQGIVKSLLDSGVEVVAASRRTENIDSRAIIKRCDIFYIEDPYNYFERPDILLHLAWRDGFIHYSSAHMEDLPKHVTFLERIASSDIQSIAILGSMHEVGFYEGSINENTPCHPQSYYGIAKNALRDYAQVLCKRSLKQFFWLRGYYIVGNSEYGSSVFSKISAAVTQGQTSFPFTYGQNQFDFIDYDQFCDMVSATVVQNAVQGIIEICSGRPEKLCDRVERFIRENNYSISLEYGAFPDRPYDSKAVWGNSRKIEKIMELQAGIR